VEFLNSLEVAGAMYNRLGPLLEEFNLLICPTLGCTGLPADFDQSKDEVQINGQIVSPFLGWCLTAPFNMLSRCPVLALPSGRAKNGVPTGIQLVGRTYCDADVFQAGIAYETALGGWFGPGARPQLQSGGTSPSR
jgi:amidase